MALTAPQYTVADLDLLPADGAMAVCRTGDMAPPEHDHTGGAIAIWTKR